MQTAQPTAQPRRPFMSWVERRQSQLEGAKSFLRARGFAVRRAREDGDSWLVSSYSGEFVAEQLLGLAGSLGYGA